MYQDFGIVSISPRLNEKTIEIIMSFDVNENTVNSSTVLLFSKDSSSEMIMKYSVSSRVIVINMIEEIIPNTEYVLKISNIENILGEKLMSGITKTLILESSVKEIPEIISPGNYEEVSGTLALKFEIIDEDYSNDDVESDISNYRIQVSNDVAFINIIRESISDDNTFIFEKFNPGQYFIRVRAEKIIEGKTNIGKWSKSVTFVSAPTNVEIDDNAPEFINEITLISSPPNGDTPLGSILLEYSDKIMKDPSTSIFVIRRDL